ncbi:MAG: hypothetical protein ACHQK8_04865, partial [Bacteroidia bacterium]
MIYRINKRNDIGLNVFVLRFANDNISQNISGSSAILRYRCSKIILEGGIETRRDRVAGWLTDLLTNAPLQMSLGGRFLFNEKKNAGIRCEYFPSTVFMENEIFKNILTTRFFYGIYF